MSVITDEMEKRRSAALAAVGLISGGATWGLESASVQWHVDHALFESRRVLEEGISTAAALIAIDAIGVLGGWLALADLEQCEADRAERDRLAHEEDLRALSAPARAASGSRGPRP